MGIMDKVGSFLGSDTVKNGVREMMIARPQDNNDLIWKHPDQTIPMFAQCTVRADEWGVFSKEGRPVGTLDAGRCTLSTANIPFLSNFIDQYTGGNFLMTELFFVKRTPFPKKFGGSLGNMIDPMTNIRLRARCHGEILLRVENPETLIYQYFGMRKYQEHADIFDWFVNSFFNTVKSTIGKMAREQRRSVLDIMDMQDELAAAVRRQRDGARPGRHPHRQGDQARGRRPRGGREALRRDAPEGRRADGRPPGRRDRHPARRPPGPGRRGRRAGQRLHRAVRRPGQPVRDRPADRAKDAAYVGMAGGDISKPRRFEAMRGAGAGIAQGGGNTGIAGLAAQVGVGAAVGGQPRAARSSRAAPARRA
jgi:hypothetical protein